MSLVVVTAVFAVLVILVTAAAALVVGLVARRRGVWLGVLGLAMLALSQVTGALLGLFLPAMMRSFRLPYSAVLIGHTLVVDLLMVLGVVLIAIGFVVVARGREAKRPGASTMRAGD